MKISRYLLSLIRLLNEVFICHSYTKRPHKIKYYPQIFILYIYKKIYRLKE